MGNKKVYRIETPSKQNPFEIKNQKQRPESAFRRAQNHLTNFPRIAPSRIKTLTRRVQLQSVGYQPRKLIPAILKCQVNLDWSFSSPESRFLSFRNRGWSVVELTARFHHPIFNFVFRNVNYNSLRVLRLFVSPNGFELVIYLCILYGAIFIFSAVLNGGNGIFLSLLRLWAGWDKSHPKGVSKGIRSLFNMRMTASILLQMKLDLSCISNQTCAIFVLFYVKKRHVLFSFLFAFADLMWKLKVAASFLKTIDTLACFLKMAPDLPSSHETSWFQISFLIAYDL